MLQNRSGLPSVWGLILVAVLAACGSDSSDDKMVAVNLSLIVEGRQAHDRSAPSRLFAWIARWFPSATPAVAQSVTDITSIQVQISGPGISPPASTTVPVSNPTSGQEIPVTLQAPVGPNRTIAVTAFNGANVKIFGGTLSGVNLTAGAPVDLVITLVRLFTVTVQKSGNGSGTVTSAPAGIDCGATCSNQFEEGASVALNAAADPGSAFDGWSGGGCSGRGSCIVNNTATVTASFRAAPNSNRLTVVKAGSGNGTVTSNPSGISCGSACAADFGMNSAVTLTAVAAEGSTFASWSAAGCGGGAPTCTIVMNVDRTVTATFTAIAPVPMSTLTVQKNGSGSGTVTSAPSGINCGNNCSADFPTGNTVSLSADSASGSNFVEWNGACQGSGSCTVTMNTDQTVSARFDVAPQFVTLTLNKSGMGSGTVRSSDGQIVCNPSCQSTQATYLQGTQVTLTATPSEGSTFDEWMGGPCNNQSGPCVLMMDRNRTAEANFDLAGGGGRGGGGGGGG